MPEILRSRIFRISAIVAAIIGLYAWFGFQMAPKIVRSQAIKFVHNTYGRDLKIGEVRVQPFKLQLEVKDLSFPDADGRAMLSFQRFFADFEVSSLWHRAYVFKALSIEAPGVHTVVRANGVVNLSDLSPKPASPAPPEEKKSALPPAVDPVPGGQQRECWPTTICRAACRTPTSFARSPLRSRISRPPRRAGGFSFSAKSEANERFDWNGRFELAPQIASQGDFTIGALQAPGVGKFLGDALPFGLSAGSIDIGGHYSVSVGEQLDLKLKLRQGGPDRPGTAGARSGPGLGAGALADARQRRRSHFLSGVPRLIHWKWTRLRPGAGSTPGARSI